MKNTQKKLITILFSTLVLGLSCSFAATKNEKGSRDWLDKKVPSILKNFSFRKLLEKQKSKMEIIVTFLIILELPVSMAQNFQIHQFKKA